MEFHIGTILFQLVSFIVLMLLVAKFAMRPMLNVMRNRQEHVDNEIDAAEKARERAEKSVEEQKVELEKARKEAYDIVENAKKNADVQGDKILKNAQEQANRTLEDARKEIELEREKAVSALHDQTAELSVMLASKIIEKELDQEQQQKEIDEFMKQVEDRI